MICFALIGGHSIFAGEHSPGMTPHEALLKLQDGNTRFAEAQNSHPHQTVERRLDVAKGQHPFAVILSCADSRVPPEVIFDQGLGDLFVVRVAGNVVTPEVQGSIEYAVDHLGAGLIVALGHERCGAVSAALAGGEAPGQIGSLVGAIAPAIESYREKFEDTPTLDDAVRANVERVVHQLKTSAPILTEQIEKGHVRVVGARYDLDDGRVDFIVRDGLEESPAAEEKSGKEKKEEGD